MSELMNITGTLNVPLILAMIVTLEFVKYVLAKEFDIRPRTEIWKYAILAVGLVAALLASDFQSLRQVIIDAIMYAAGATIVYQTFKKPIKRLVFRFMDRIDEGDDDAVNDSNGD